MKKTIGLMLTLCALLTSCTTTNEIMFSNMADTNSKSEVECILKQVVNSKNVDQFIAEVSNYNEIIENASLKSGFEPTPDLITVKYDNAKINKLWIAKKDFYPGTNCRINTFMLLKDDIEISDSTYDDSLLFVDLDSLDLEKKFTDDELKKFKILFSRIPTEVSTDQKVHIEKMQTHFSKIKFSDKAKMLTVIINDNFGESELYVGHTGVLVEKKNYCLFVEKLSFAEPYQAIKFPTKKALFAYLQKKYEKYHDETTALPFILENGKLVE